MAKTKRNHPLINFVLAIVALIVGDARAGHGGLEAVGLRDAPHGHEAAVAPAGEAEAIGIDGSGAEGFLHAGEDVAKIAVAEIADVGARKGFALAKTAARVGFKEKIAGARKGDRKISRIRPARLDRGARAAVDLHDHGIFFRGIEVARIDEPALNVESFVFPVETLGVAPGRFHCGVALGNLPPIADEAGPDFRWIAE